MGSQPDGWPGPIVLLPSRLKWSAMSVVALAVGVGLLVGAAGEVAAMAFAAGAFLFGAVCAVKLLPGAGSLTLDANGFEVSHFFRKKRFAWTDVSNFSVHKLGQHGDVVAFETTQPLGAWDKANAVLIGGKANLPDSYGGSLDELAQLMTDWRNSAGRSAA